MIIQIKFGYDLPTAKQNKLRYRMELAKWKEQWREAVNVKDYAKMDRLDVEYEMVGLP